MSYDNSQIWMFREPRSGGSGFTMALAKALNKKTKFAVSIKDIVNDSDVIIDTHTFHLLPYVGTNDIILRCVRRDKVEQILSYYLMLLTGRIAGRPLFNIYTNMDNDKTKIEAFNSLIGTKIKVPKSIVDSTCHWIKNAEALWNQHQSNHKNHTFYYEDVSDLVDFSFLGEYNLEINRGEQTTKLPYNKQEVFINYDEVVEWVNEYYR